MSETCSQAFSRRRAPTARLTLALKAPARPLSPATTIRSTFFSSRSARSGCRASRTRAETLASTSRSDAAYGRAAITRSCERRSFAAATIFIARVICWMFLTDRSRRRMSIRDAMALYFAFAFALRRLRLRVRVLLEEARLEVLDRGDERLLGDLLHLSGLEDRRTALV